MTVYVDDKRAKFGRLILCHMIADTDDELHAMAARIGVARKWHQTPGPKSHYDIALSKKALAIEFGAVPITMRQCGMMCANRTALGTLGEPQTAARVFTERWCANQRALGVNALAKIEPLERCT